MDRQPEVGRAVRKGRRDLWPLGPWASAVEWGTSHNDNNAIMIDAVAPAQSAVSSFL